LTAVSCIANRTAADNGTRALVSVKTLGMVVSVDHLGFLLLALVYLLQGAGWAAVALRVAVAAGFALLGWMQLRSGR
jgi:hypothetical protein